MTAKGHVKHQLKVDICTITQKRLNSQSYDRRHGGGDCVRQVFQHSFHHVDHLEALEINASNKTLFCFTGLKNAYMHKQVIYIVAKGYDNALRLSKINCSFQPKQKTMQPPELIMHNTVFMTNTVA